MKEMLRRAARTFAEAALGYVAANIVMAISTGESISVKKTALLGLCMSAVASGISAVLNMPKKREAEEKKKAKQTEADAVDPEKTDADG